MIFGISGYMGSGKSSAAKYICGNNFLTLINADKTARKLMENSDAIRKKINNAFNVEFDKRINFKTLGEIVFSSVENLEKLNSITFPYIIKDINMQINNSYSLDTVVDAALLPLINTEVTCDLSIWIDSEIDARIQRLVNRTKLSREVIKNRVEMQMALMPKPQDSALWRFVENNSSLENLLDEIDRICYGRAKT